MSAGLGLLTGSTAILLTLLGGCCIIVDKCDPENSREKASEETARGFSLAGTSLYSSVIKSLLVSRIHERLFQVATFKHRLILIVDNEFNCSFSSLSKLNNSYEVCCAVSKTI